MRKLITIEEYEANQGLADFLSDLYELIDSSCDKSERECVKLYEKLKETYSNWLDEKYDEWLISKKEYESEDR
jgi:hypothetical protein